MDNSSHQSNLPTVSVLIQNVAKKNNVGEIIRSCVALGAKELAWTSRLNTERITKATGITNEPLETLQEEDVVKRPDKPNMFGSHGSAHHLPLRHFKSLQKAKQYYNENNVQIVGVEIHPTSIAVQNYPWKGNTVLLMGNEGDGLHQDELEICDALVYIPQYGKGTASLNVNVACGIVLHHFALWAKFQEQARNNDKFVVEKAKGLILLEGNVKDEEEMRDRLRQARLKKKINDSTRQDIETG